LSNGNSDAEWIKYFKHEVKRTQGELKKLRAESMPVIKLTGKLQGLDRVRILERLQKELIETVDYYKKKRCV